MSWDYLPQECIPNFTHPHGFHPALEETRPPNLDAAGNMGGVQISGLPEYGRNPAGSKLCCWFSVRRDNMDIL